MQSSDGQARSVPGHALVMQADKPFRGLASFGNNFLSKFEGAEIDATILRNVTIIDTPGKPFLIHIPLPFSLLHLSLSFFFFLLYPLYLGRPLFLPLRVSFLFFRVFY